jgi:hypothetical protein
MTTVSEARDQSQHTALQRTVHQTVCVVPGLEYTPLQLCHYSNIFHYMHCFNAQPSDHLALVPYHNVIS